MDLERPLPQPLTPEGRPYWDGLKQGKLMIPRCEDCQRAFFYPRVVCPGCGSRRHRWEQASGRGRLHAFSIVHQSINKAMRLPLPYVLAMIELDEGPRMMSNLVNVEPDPAWLRCDMPVRVLFRPLTEDVTISLWEPAPAEPTP